MNRYVGAAAVAGLLIFGYKAHGETQTSVAPKPAVAQAKQPPVDWSAWKQPLGAPIDAPPRAAAAEIESQEQPQTPAAEIDVVDAHWMALTMWGEARGDGETGMRAVGHVIYNRKQAGGRYGDYVTDTVSQAFQFSCWNRGDPNLAAMMNIDALPKDSRDYQLWLAARRIADEILSGQSQDMTGGALFYHTAEVSPKWSQGISPVQRIGRHLFFRSVA